MKKFFKEFKEFAFSGNVMNLAIGVIIGGAFQSVVNSLTADILAPLIGIFAGQNFYMLEAYVLGVHIRYGSFITMLINFLIMAFVVFMLVKAVNKASAMGKKADAPTAAEPTTRTCPYCASEISLKATRCPACTSDLNNAG